MRQHILLLFTTTLLFACSSSAQMGRYNSKNKGAIKQYEKALKAYRDVGIVSGSIESAENYLNKAIKKDANFVDAYMMLSQIKLEQGDLKSAISAKKTGLQINPQFSKIEYFLLAEMQMKAKDYDDAAKNAKQYLTFKNINPTYERRAKLFIANVAFAKQAIQNPVPFNPINLGKNINSSQSEYHPTIMGDENTITYTRTIKDDRVMGRRKEHEDLYTSVRASDGEWVVSQSASNRINSILNEGSSTVSADGNYLIFTSCAGPDGYGQERRGLGSCDLFYSKKIGKRWSKPRNMGRNINTPFWESQPCFSADGTSLYFIRRKSRQADKSLQDIYMSKLTDAGWSVPTKLSDKINTPEAEQTVYIHPDGQTLYFASEGHPGMGGLDLFVSRKDAKGNWGTPVNLGYPINTEKDEDGIIVSPDGNRAYFASTREGGFGQSDIYYFDLPDYAKPVLTTYMKGIVFDGKSKMPLSASVQLIDLETGEPIVNSFSNDMTGDFLVNIPTNKKLALNVSKNGYFFYSKNYTFDMKDYDGKPFLIDVPLDKIEVSDKGFVLENVFFDVNKFDLKPASKVELNKLYEFLANNKTIKVELGGHTDSDGDDKQNQILSQNRAKAVVDYLITKGIDKTRLTYKGYGETKPVVENTTPANKAKNRRTEVKIIGK